MFTLRKYIRAVLRDTVRISLSDNNQYTFGTQSMKIHTEIQQPCPEHGSATFLRQSMQNVPFSNLLPPPESMRFGGYRSSQAIMDFYSGGTSGTT